MDPIDLPTEKSKKDYKGENGEPVVAEVIKIVWDDSTNTYKKHIELKSGKQRKVIVR